MIGLVIAAVVLGLVHYLLHRRLVRATEIGRPWRRVIDTVLVLGWAAAVIGTSVGVLLPTGWLRPIGFVGLTWLVVVFYLLLGLAVIGVVLLVLRLVGRLRHRSTARERLLVIRTATAVLAVVASGAALYGVTEAATPRVIQQTVTLPRLPAEFDGTRVAVISDLHLGPARGAGFTQKVVDLVNEQNPDLIVVLGDLADGTISHVGEDLEPLTELRAPLGIYGVAGNHEEISDDVGAWMSYQQSLGIRPLNNERTEIRRGGAVIDLAGVYDYSAAPPYEADLDAALAGRDPQRFVLLLAHQPNQVRQAAEAGVDLQLSGHTHGGQIWPLRAAAALAADTNVTGFDQVGQTVLYTTYGAGAWGPPVRVGAPPEISILQLESS
nr:metallophosphoesterase [Gordonia sp. LAM0048]